MPSLPSRRAFLSQTAGALATAATLSPASALRVQGANERIGLGVIGPGGMGMNLLRSFVRQPDVEIAFVCDPDESRQRQAVQEVEKAGRPAPRAVKDLREVLASRAVDAVVIATPDHWHGPATLLACEAGKHVYVEKPAAHNVREGRLMVEAARRTGRVIQVGTQARSTAHVRRAMEHLHNGAIGEVLTAKVWNSQLRGNIGRAQPAPPPDGLDFDLWLGPAPAVPYRRNLLHSSWRWFRDFGTGDMGNDGVHDLDLARWGLRADRHPNRVFAVGGKYVFDDDQEFPDTQTVVFEYAAGTLGRQPRQLLYEQRLWSPYVQEGYENGNAFYGTQGMLLLAKHGGYQLFGPRNQLVEKVEGSVDSPAHHRNFLDCLKSGQRPHADIEIGHLSASLCHLGNLATRLGRVLRFDPDRERFPEDPDADAQLRRAYREGHWARPAGV